MTEYFIHEDGDPDIGYTWDLFKRDGDRVVRIASFYEEVFATKILASVKWYETFEDGQMSVPKPKQKTMKIIFTPSKKKATR